MLHIIKIELLRKEEKERSVFIVGNFSSQCQNLPWMANFRNRSGRESCPVFHQILSSLSGWMTASSKTRQTPNPCETCFGILKSSDNGINLSAQLNFHCLICSRKKHLGKSFKSQFVSEPHWAQSLGSGECFYFLPVLIEWGNRLS